MNIFPTKVNIKTNRMNRVVTTNTIKEEEDFIINTCKINDLDNIVELKVIDLYRKVYSKCAVHSWKKTNSRKALILCCFYIISIKEECGAFISINKICKMNKINIKELLGFKSLVMSGYSEFLSNYDEFTSVNYTPKQKVKCIEIEIIPDPVL